MNKTIEDFEYYVNKTKTCWLWIGGLDTSGYGSLNWDGRVLGAHRVARSLYANFDLNSELHVLHKSICPNKHCINPEHTYEGTPQDNMNDIVESGKHNQASKTHCPSGHEYSKENTGYYYGYTRGLTLTRYCKECKRIYYKNKKAANGH
jgi:hypothetical protein